MFLAQAAGAAVPVDFDLRNVKHVASPSCGRTTSREDGEIVVCGRRIRHDDRVTAAPDTSDAPRNAEFGLIGKARIRLDSEAGVGGIPRVMVRIKIPF